jgi:hypothetical protein
MIEKEFMSDLLPGMMQRSTARDDTGVCKNIRCYIEYLNAEASRLNVPIKIVTFLDPINNKCPRIELDYDGPIPEAVRGPVQALFIKATTFATNDAAIQYLRGLAVMIFMAFLTAQVHKEEQEGSANGQARQV